MGGLGKWQLLGLLALARAQKELPGSQSAQNNHGSSSVNLQTHDLCLNLNELYFVAL